MAASMPTLGSLSVKDTILYRALRLAQVATGPGRTPSPEDFTDALDALNGLIDSLNIQQAAIYSVQPARYTLSPPKKMYTIGIDPTGATIADFQAPRPIRIDQARLVLTSSPTPVYLPLKLVTNIELASITVRDIWSSVPTALYCDYNYPLAGLYFWPAPSQANDVELWTWQPTQEFQTIDDAVLMPTGYTDMLVYQLAVRMSEQNGRAPMPNVLATANRLLGRVKALNDPTDPIASVDWGTGGTSGGYFNYLSGGPA